MKFCLVTNTIQLPLKTVEDVAGSDFSLAVTNYTSHYDLLMVIPPLLSIWFR